MTECYLCYTPLKDGQPEGDAHPACRKEWYARAARNECTMCSKKLKPTDLPNHCNTYYNERYKGYPGSQ